MRAIALEAAPRPYDTEMPAVVPVVIDGPLRRRQGNRFLNHVMQAVLRRDVPVETPDPDVADIYYEEVRLTAPDDPVRGPYVMPLVTLRTNPCRWSTSAGCVMCGYHLGAHRGTVGDDNLVAQTADVIRRLNPKVYPTLVFTSNGSFLDPAEVSDEVRPVLLRMLRDAGFRFLVVETRPEFITPTRLDAMVAAFSPESPAPRARHPISLSFGLESSNDFVQQYCVNKGRRRDDYVKAFAVLREARFHIDSYVLLGKPFMTAREDVDDAVETIRFAVDSGVGYVFVMVTNMVAYSLTSYLHERGRYHLPSLWRAVELLERLPERYRAAVQVKGISHAPVGPRYYARTCENCTEHVKGCLNFWNQTGEFEHIRSIAPCSCRHDFVEREWAREEPKPLVDRVLDEYSRLASELEVPAELLPTRDDLARTDP
jgi:radical SAM enzyme (TIGR01210 family)